MGEPITTIEQVELIAGQNSGVINVLLNEIKNKDSEIQQLSDTIDILLLDSLEVQ